jgi:aryl-alcohol dehydrogenase-like predicted oxidoreductase
MTQRTLGSNGWRVSALGFGRMGISFGYGQPTSRDDAVNIIRAAVDAGITFFDAADVYGPFANEELVGEALGPVRDQVVIATKFGFRIEDATQAGLDRRPSHIRDVADASLQRLESDRIDLLISTALGRSRKSPFRARGTPRNGRPLQGAERETTMTTRTSPLLTLNNGVQIPAVGLGVFQSPLEQTAGAVESAFTGASSGLRREPSTTIAPRPASDQGARCTRQRRPPCASSRRDFARR